MALVQCVDKYLKTYKDEGLGTPLAFSGTISSTACSTPENQSRRDLCVPSNLQAVLQSV